MPVKLRRITPKGRGLEDLLRRVRKTAGVQVYIDSDARYPDGTKVEDAAEDNELGKERVPARPFWKHTFSRNRKLFMSAVEKSLKRLLGRKALIRDIEHALGFLAVEKVKETITKWKKPPNAPMTIRLKGFDDPLVHTKLLQRSIEWRRRRG